MEIERKFLVLEPPHALLAVTPAHLRQGYIATGDRAEVRLRDADGACTLTVKSDSGLVRQEYEIGLDSGQFEALWPATAGQRLEKHRYAVAADNLRYEVDVYEGSLAGLMVVEVEFRSVQEAHAFAPPEWFGREVTGEAAYSNASLSLRGAPDDPAGAR